MLEMRVSITAADLAEAINNLADAISGKNLKPIARTKTPAGSAPVVQPAIPMVPVNPTTAPVATPAQTETPIVPTVPVAAPAPAVIPAANVAPAPTVPTSAPQYTLDMIATAGSALIDAGKMDQLMQLLGKFGIASLTELAPENYGAMANELRAIGASI